MQIGPMSAVMQNRLETSSIAFACDNPGNCGDQPIGSFAPSNGTIDTKVSTDWNISVGGRIGWLANQGTLLYVLAAYTHADLSDAQVKVSIPDPNDLVGVLLGGAPGTSPFPINATSLLVKLPDSLDGWSLGGGAEAKLGGPWTLKTRIPVDASRRWLWTCERRRVAVLL